MAQATGVLSFKTAQQRPDDRSLYYLAGIDKARFRQPVEPGDQLWLHVDIVRSGHGVWKYNCRAEVANKVVATAELMCVHRSIADDSDN